MSHQQESPHLKQADKSTLASPHSLHLRSQESRRITSIRTISQVSSSDYQSSRTDHITHSAVDLSLILGIIRDPTTILQITGESEENNSLYLIFDTRVEFLDCVVDYCAALTVILSAICLCKGSLRIVDGVGGRAICEGEHTYTPRQQSSP